MDGELGSGVVVLVFLACLGVLGGLFWLVGRLTGRRSGDDAEETAVTAHATVVDRWEEDTPDGRTRYGVTFRLDDGSTVDLPVAWADLRDLGVGAHGMLTHQDGVCRRFVPERTEA